MKKCFLVILGLVALYGSSGIDVWDTETWNPPVLQGEHPFIQGDRFYILDRDGDKVRVYDIAEGLKHARFLWSTPGKGQGPGEMNSDIIDTVVVNPGNGNLWLGHSRGLIVFGPGGKLLHQKKFSFSRSRFLPVANRVYRTPRRLLRDYSTILKVYDRASFLDNPKSESLHETEALHGLAVIAEGGYVTPHPSLFYFDSKVYLLDAAIGEVLKLDEKGRILGVHQIKIKDRERFTPVGYEPYKHTEEILALQHRTPAPGLVPDGEHFWTVSRHYYERSDKTHSMIVRFKMGEETLSRFTLPGVQSRLTVLKKQEKALIFFDLGEGHLLYRVDLSSLKPFSPGDGI